METATEIQEQETRSIKMLQRIEEKRAEIIEGLIGVNNEIKRWNEIVDERKGELKEAKEELSGWQQRLQELVNKLEEVDKGQLPLPFPKGQPA